MQDKNDTKLEIEDKVSISGRVTSMDKNDVTIEIVDENGSGHCVTLSASQVGKAVKKGK